MIGELKSVVTGELISITSIFVLFVAVIAVPVVLLNRGSAFVDVITRTLVTLKRMLNEVLWQVYGLVYRFSPP